MFCISRIQFFNISDHESEYEVRIHFSQQNKFWDLPVIDVQIKEMK